MALSTRIFIIANSEYSKQRFNEQISGKFKVNVLYNAFNTDVFSPAK